MAKNAKNEILAHFKNDPKNPGPKNGNDQKCQKRQNNQNGQKWPFLLKNFSNRFP